MKAAADANWIHRLGAIGAAIYLILCSLFLLYSIYALWPPPSQDNMVTGNSGIQPLESTGTGVNDFSIALDKQTIQVVPNSFPTYFIRVRAFGNFSSPVDLSVAPPTPSVPGLSAAVNPPSVIPPKNGTALSDRELSVPPGTKPGNFSMTLTGKEGAMSHSVTATIIVMASGATITDNAQAHSVYFNFLDILKWKEPNLSDETRLWLIVTAAAALGGTLHGLRSLFWYVGNRAFIASWLLMYLLLPLTGAIMGLGFYFIIRGGFFSPSTTAQGTSPYGFAALAFVIGLFSGQANLKLKQIFETLFTAPAPGKDARPQEGTATEASFTLDVQKPPAISPGNTANLTITVTPVGDFNGMVTLTATPSPPDGAPKLVRSEVNPASVPVTGAVAKATLIVETDPNVTVGTEYPILLVGRSSTLKQLLTITVKV